MTTAEVITLNPHWFPEISFGTRLREARLAWGRRFGVEADQAAFAELLGVKRSTLGASERGANIPTTERQEELAYLLQERTGVAAVFLLGMTEKDGGPGGSSTPQIIDGRSFACTRTGALATVTALTGRRVA